jgi:hypothetical protein
MKQINRQPIVIQCMTAALEVMPDPKNKDKKISIQVPCKRIDGDYKTAVCEEGEAPLLLCTTYETPTIKWRVGACPFAQKAPTKDQERMLNPLKASKRAAGK